MIELLGSVAQLRGAAAQRDFGWPVRGYLPRLHSLGQRSFHCFLEYAALPRCDEDVTGREAKLGNARGGALKGISRDSGRTLQDVGSAVSPVGNRLLEASGVRSEGEKTQRRVE